MTVRVEFALSDPDAPDEVAERPSSALKYLQGIYCNPMEPTSVRMRAAALALPFESPKLSVTTLIDEGDFADRLERAILRSQSPPRQITLKANETSPSVSWNGPLNRPVRRLTSDE